MTELVTHETGTPLVYNMIAATVFSGVLAIRTAPCRTLSSSDPGANPRSRILLRGAIVLLVRASAGIDVVFCCWLYCSLVMINLHNSRAGLRKSIKTDL